MGGSIERKPIYKKKAMDPQKSNYLASRLSKGEKSRHRIIEATISSISKYGFEEASISIIAKIAKVNKGLIVHYFKSRDELVMEAINYVAILGAQVTETLIKNTEEAVDPIEKYLYATFEWMTNYPEHAHLIILLFPRASYDVKSRNRAQKLYQTSWDRIEKMLQDGIKKNRYRQGNHVQLARQIHMFLIGAIVTSSMDPEVLLPQYREHCLFAVRRLILI